jgi:hypothetical protein
LSFGQIGLTGEAAFGSIVLWHTRCGSNGPADVIHVTARDNDRQDLFHADADRFHFLELLSELGERFGLRVHGCVLMGDPFSAKQAAWA